MTRSVHRIDLFAILQPTQNKMNTQPTPETDREDIIITKGKPTHWVSQEFARRLKRERDEARETLAATLRAWQEAQEKIIAVTEERDEAREVLKITQEAWVKAKAERVEALRERDEAREELTDMIEQRNYFLIRLEEAQEHMIDAEKQREKQRDKLAEALERIIEEDGVPMSMRASSSKSLAKQALQSLTTNAEL